MLGHVADPLLFGAVAVKSRPSSPAPRCRGCPGRPVLPAPAQVGALAAVDAHDPLDAFAADLDAAVAQLPPHSRRVAGGELVLTRISSIMASSSRSSPARRELPPAGPASRNRSTPGCPAPDTRSTRIHVRQRTRDHLRVGRSPTRNTRWPPATPRSPGAASGSRNQAPVLLDHRRHRPITSLQSVSLAIQFRNASRCSLSCSSRRITGFGSDSRYNRTASRNSTGYFLVPTRLPSRFAKSNLVRKSPENRKTNSRTKQRASTSSKARTIELSPTKTAIS